MLLSIVPLYTALHRSHADISIVRQGSAWLLTGDFNEITDNPEKSRGKERPESFFSNFRSFLSNCDLFDIRHAGNFLSWKGTRHTHLVHCRLDRAMANNEWSSKFPNARSHYLAFEGSDHRPLLSVFDTRRKKSKRLFRYDRRLKDNTEVKNLIDEVWKDSRHLPISERLDNCRKAISAWSRKHYVNSQKQIAELRDKLDKALSAPTTDDSLISSLNKDLLQAYRAEEAYWKLRSRQTWLALGDRNTSYFHASTKGRRARNRITVIENAAGVPVFEEAQIAEAISEYFSSIFTSTNPHAADLVLQAIAPCISEATNQKLISAPTTQKIKDAMFSIHPNKAPGPDGFSASFFQSNWDIIGPAETMEIQEFFTSGNLPTSINTTHIRVISKITGPKAVMDYMPIALCNVYYKVISKILSIRLKPVLQEVISENQSVFVPGRAISDNVLITHEMLHYLKNLGATIHCSMAVKTDISKAYDRLEWTFIREVLGRMGFHLDFIHWKMECITTVSYSFLINNEALGNVMPQRGIRQGDPLSPYIFILCGEVLSGLCKREQEKRTLAGLRVARNSPRINHLLFADDTMFFSKTDPQCCASLLNILHEYERASGQMINTAKSSISFSAKTSQEIRTRVKEHLGIEKEGGVGKYLGLPEHFRRKKKDLFSSIVDKIHQKASWSTRFLSTAGKATMIQSVMSAVPSYAMTCFELPVGLCKKIQ